MNAIGRAALAGGLAVGVAASLITGHPAPAAPPAAHAARVGGLPAEAAADAGLTADLPAGTAARAGRAAGQAARRPALAGAADRLVPTTVRPLAGTTAAPFDRVRRLDAPPGWTVTVWARVPKARLLAWTPDNRLLVSRPEHGDILTLTPGTEAPTPRTLVSGLNKPHGLAFAGSTLYVAESDQVDSFTYRAGALTRKRVVVDNLPDDRSPELRGQYAHELKSVAVGQGGVLYVSVGSTGNISAEDRTSRPERATILRVQPGGRPTVYARGVRNGTGLAIAPDGAVWTAVNSRDQVPYPYDRDISADGRSDLGAVLQAYVNDHPFEPLARLTQGRDLGWPYCNPDPAERPTSYTRRPFVRDFQTNRDGSKLDCGSLPPIEQGVGAHSAPLGLSFAKGAGSLGPGALLGLHGSWNRQPPRSPEVSFFPWRNNTLGPQQTLLTGFQQPDGWRWGRPVMAVQGPDDALYVSDDKADAIYRVTAR
ncbi:PQQ-dependent sugar dehydrogenase [Cryptosporangium sp. NPDC048952]|uniref:PQQ-dependent sugar dehydrogenase n=1 Tax=Cryptosporangium sp. NPDC048952 TaxID=3363961 RepID=UPI0037172D46